MQRKPDTLRTEERKTQEKMLSGIHDVTSGCKTHLRLKMNMLIKQLLLFL